jgi:hypothetical protein
MRSVSEVVDRERMWKLLTTVVGLIGGLLARKALRAAYEAIRKDPDAPSPFDPTNAQFSWVNVVVWALAAGLGLGIAKVVSARLATLGWEVATGTLPPGVRADDPSGPRLASP